MAKSPETDVVDAPKRSRWPAALVMVAGISSLLGFGTLFSIWANSEAPDGHARLRLAQQQYLDGNALVAGKLAEQVELDPENEEDQPWLALQAFLIGAGHIAKSEQTQDSTERRALLVQSIPQLQTASGYGFPPGREAEGNRLLGTALLQTGNFDDAADSLREAISADLTLKTDLLPDLAESLLRQGPDSADRAKETIDEFLNMHSLSADERRKGILIKLKTLLAKKEWPEISVTIRDLMQELNAADLATQAKLADYRDELRLLDAKQRILSTIDQFGIDPDQIEPDRENMDLEEAIRDQSLRSDLAQALADPLRALNRLHREAAPRMAARAKLVAAEAYRAQGDVSQAITQLTAVRQQRPFGAEGLAAGIAEVELLADQGRGLEVVQTIRYVMRELGSPDQFDASLISLKDFKRRLVGAVQTLRGNGVYQAAIDAARSLSPMFSRSEALLQEGLGFERWASSTMAEGRDSGGAVGRTTAQLARSRYRAAGDAFEQAANLEFNSQRYLPLLWSAIDSYQQGRHFSRSIELLGPYLRYEQRRRKPRGLVAYGRALLAEGKPDLAMDALETCIVEFPRDPLRYDARLMAAHASIELHNRTVKNNSQDAATGTNDDGGDGDPTGINTPLLSEALLLTKDPGETNDSEEDLDAPQPPPDTRVSYLTQAKMLLRANLEDGDLRPDSPTSRNSLVTLGNLLYEQVSATELKAAELNPAERRALIRSAEPELRQAIATLDEVVQRYWPQENHDPRFTQVAHQQTESTRDAESAAYYLARCHRLSAEWAELESQTPEMLDAARRALRQRSADERRFALQGFTALRKKYETYEEEHRLTQMEDTMLRNCLIAEADTLQDMKLYADASTAYRFIALRYRDEPIALEAFLGQINCVRQLGRDREAELLIQQAAVVLQKIPPEWDGRFEDMTRFDREEWGRFLNWMTRQIAPTNA